MKTLIAILIGVILTVFFFLWGAFMSGGGHSLTAITIFFPYACIAALMKDAGWYFIGDVTGLLLGASQFPLYAILLAQLKGTRRKSLGLVVLLVSHAAAAVVGLKTIW